MYLLFFKLLVLATLVPGKETPVPMGLEAGWSADWIWMLWRKDWTLPLPEIDPFHPVQSDSTTGNNQNIFTNEHG